VIILLDSYRGFFNRGNNPSLRSTVAIIFSLIICLSCFSTTVFADSRARAYDFTFEFGVKTAAIEPDETGVVDLWLNNTGDSDDSYTLSVEDMASGWTVSLYTVNEGKLSDNPTLSLAKNNNKLIQAWITAPNSGKTTLNVKCKSQTTTDEKSASVQLDAKFIVKVNLKDTNNVHLVKAGKNTTFNLEIRNFQDISDEVSLSIYHTQIIFQNKPDDTKWGVNFDNDVVSLAAEESKTVVLTVYAPNFGQPGDKISLIVVASPDSTSQEFESQNLVSEIPKVYNVTYNVTLDPPDQLTLPNSTINYTLKLQNNGNIDDIITLKPHENTNNWGIFFFLDDSIFFPNQETIDMKVNDVVILQLEVEIPLDALSKPHVIEYGIYSANQGGIKSINNIIIKTQVELISDIEIYIPEYDSNIDVGKESFREIIVHNKGNGNANLEVSIPKDLIPTGWEIAIQSVKNTKEINITQRVDFNKPIVFDEFEIDEIEYLPEVVSKYRNITLNLGANKQAYVVLSIIPPSTGKAGTETFTIYGESVSANIDTTTKSMSLNLQLSELSISPIKVDPEIPTPDEKVEVSFNITNDYHVAANNFKVTLIEINDRGVITVIDSKDISTLEPGETQTVSFTWTPQEATEKGYILKAELKGDIIPKDNTAPFRNQNVFVVDKPPKSESDDNVLLIALAMIIIIFVIILLIMLLIGQKRAKENSEKGEESKKSEERKKSWKEPPRQLSQMGKQRAKTSSKSTYTGKRPQQGSRQKNRK
jgi:uncharacterized membrane protein